MCVCRITIKRLLTYLLTPRSRVRDVLAVVAVILLTLLTFDVCMCVGYDCSWPATEGQGHTSVIGQGQRSLLPCQHHACGCV